MLSLCDADRCVDPNALPLLIRVMHMHGVGSFIPKQNSTANVSEREKLSVLPLLFYLLPRSALARKDSSVLVKPMITERLKEIGFIVTDELLDVLKAVADNYYYSSESLGRRTKKKMAMRDLRARADLYHKIITRQVGRCAICGIHFTKDNVQETLDHILPYRIGGDPPDGRNWQIACEKCNSAKGDLFSIMQSQFYYNWVYCNERDIHSHLPIGPIRVISLLQKGKCDYLDCQATPQSAQLFCERKDSKGLWIIDNMRVVCDRHRS